VNAGALGVSVLVQITLTTALVLVPVLFPKVILPQVRVLAVSLMGPPLDVPPPKPPEVKQVEEVKVIKVAKVILPPQPPIIPKPEVIKYLAPPKIQPPKVVPRKVDEATPEIEQKFKPTNELVLNNDLPPAKPRESVKTGLIAPALVQTGGYGDPHGVPATGDPNKRTNIGTFGDPSLPIGAGYGNGTGGAKGMRGALAGGGNGGRAVSVGGFNNQEATTTQAAKKEPEKLVPAGVPEILSKPRPMYSDEARKLNLEGEVLLNVVFMASGNDVRVTGVKQGLGHGLDEAAKVAAAGIKYKPAMTLDGTPVDFIAIVHIVFQLAN
jgi:hypothetical protein